MLSLLLIPDYGVDGSKVKDKVADRHTGHVESGSTIPQAGKNTQLNESAILTESAAGSTAIAMEQGQQARIMQG